jgi:hypothetical protein
MTVLPDPQRRFMKRLSRLLLLFSIAGMQCTRTESPIVGTWQGKLHDLPGATLVVKNDNGKLTGSIVFYLQQRDGDSWKVVYENMEPLIKPRLDGQTFFFQVSHENAHPGESGPSDPPVKFEVTLTGKDEGTLRSTNYGDNSELKMTRAK